MTLPALDRWYGYMATHDKAALWDLLDPEAVFESPVVHTPQRGREIAFKYLTGADQVLGGASFATSASGAMRPAPSWSSRPRSRASGSTAST